jgi:hypothetical protein
MSKRKRATPGKTPATPGQQAAPDESTDDAAVKDDMAHVAPDLLAGSPDIFAGKKAEPTLEELPAPAAETTEWSAEATVPEATAEPAPAEPADADPAPAEPAEASASLIPEPEPPSMATEPSTTPSPPYVDAVAYPAPQRRGGSSLALGIVLVVVGIFAFIVVMAGVDLTQYGWPLFVIIPGLTLLVVGFAGVGSVATIPGGIVTMLGLVLAYQNSSGDWPSWAFAWALVVPGGVGLGMYLQALRDHDQHALRTGRTLIFISVMIFIIGFVLFESILGISGRDYGGVGKAALPVLLIVIGLILLIRSMQRSRRPS